MSTPAPDRTAGMRQQRRTLSEDKHQAVHAAVTRCVTRGVVESAAAVARAAGVTETFLYRHETSPCSVCQVVFGCGPVSFYRSRMSGVAAARESSAEREGRLTAASVQADLANSRAAAQRLRLQVRALERRLGEVEGARAEGGLDELARLAQDVDPATGRRLEELSDQVRALTARLSERDEELAAVRRLNADLTRRLNIVRA